MNVNSVIFLSFNVNTNEFNILVNTPNSGHRSKTRENVRLLENSDNRKQITGFGKKLKENDYFVLKVYFYSTLNLVCFSFCMFVHAISEERKRNKLKFIANRTVNISRNTFFFCCMSTYKDVFSFFITVINIILRSRLSLSSKLFPSVRFFFTVSNLKNTLTSYVVFFYIFYSSQNMPVYKEYELNKN